MRRNAVRTGVQLSAVRARGAHVSANLRPRGETMPLLNCSIQRDGRTITLAFRHPDGRRLTLEFRIGGGQVLGGLLTLAACADVTNAEPSFDDFALSGDWESHE